MYSNLVGTVCIMLLQAMIFVMLIRIENTIILL